MEDVPFVRGKVVVQCGQHHIVSDQHPVADDDAALVLELAVGIDENTVSERDVLSKIGIERRLDPHPFADRLRGDLSEQLRDLVFILMPEIVHLKQQPSVFLNVPAHARNDFRIVAKLAALIKPCKKLIEFHQSKVSLLMLSHASARPSAAHARRRSDPLCRRQAVSPHRQCAGRRRSVGPERKHGP